MTGTGDSASRPPCAAPQSHWKRQRLATLLAEVVGDRQGQGAELRQAIDHLSRLEERINLLCGSMLYPRVRVRSGWRAPCAGPGTATGSGRPTRLASRHRPGSPGPAHDWLRAGRRVDLLRPPPAHEFDLLRADIIKQHEQRRRRGPRQVTEAGPVQDTLAALADAVGLLHRLATCRLCPGTSAVAFEDRHGGTFHCRCACGGQWGTRRRGCGAVFPVLWAGSTAPPTGRGDLDGDEIDARFGSEVLALPCPSFPDWTRFRCPRCGTCQGSASCACPPAGRH